MNDPLYVQWINASINTYFDGLKQDVPLYIEGQEINYETEPKLAELRITGPRVKELTKNSFQTDVDIDIMCTCKLDSNDYTIHKVVGIFYQAMTGPINVYKHNGSDNPEYIGCLILRSDVDTPRDVIPWGLVQVSDGPLRVNQTSIAGQYWMRVDL